VKVTEVMPAQPPQMRREREERSAPGEDSKKFLETPDCQYAAVPPMFPKTKHNAVDSPSYKNYSSQTAQRSMV
jgi:hypothetical protein